MVLLIDKVRNRRLFFPLESAHDGMRCGADQRLFPPL